MAFAVPITYRLINSKKRTDTPVVLENCDILWLEVTRGTLIHFVLVIEQKCFRGIAGQGFELICKVRLVIVTRINRNLCK